jgi:serine/threonine protein kinase
MSSVISSSDFMNPSQHYVLNEELGSGLFGTVYSATELASGKRVAVKITENTVENRKEGSFLQQAQHQGVVGFYESFASEGKWWTVMELVEGDQLAWTLCSQHSFVTPSHVAHVASKLAQALQATHASGLLHLDVKSDNILVDAVTGALKLADFGRAAHAHSPPANRGEVLCWTAPEVVCGEAYSAAADVWGLGIVVVEAALGQAPFFGEEDMAESIANGPEPRLDQSEYPADMCDFVERCLQRDPHARAGLEELLSHPFVLKACSQAEFADWALGKLALQAEMRRAEQELKDFEAEKQALESKASKTGVRGLVARFELAGLNGSGVLQALTATWLDSRAAARR